MRKGEFLKWVDAASKWMVNYRSATCRQRSVLSPTRPNDLVARLPKSPPAKGERWEDIMRDMDALIAPSLVGWESSNRFFGFFKPHASYPSVVGELLSAGVNNMGFNWAASPACTELELVTMDWLCEFLRFPERFHSSQGGQGVIQTSAGEACMVALLGAIEECGGQRRDQMVVYMSDQAHSTCVKACKVLGVQHRVLPTSAATAWALAPEVLDRAIQSDRDRDSELRPIAVILTAGTTSSCAFDPIREINPIAQSHGAWVHVDAAYGGAYCALEEERARFSGLEGAHSVVVNAHKKLLTNFDLSALYIAEPRVVQRRLSMNPAYLQNKDNEEYNKDLCDLQLGLGRRFRSLKLWFVMRSFGSDAIREHVRQGIQLREAFQQLVQGDSRFEVMAPGSLSVLCFRWRGFAGMARDTAALNDLQYCLLDRINASQQCFMIQTMLGDDRVLRIACGGMEQTAEDIQSAWEVIQSAVSELETVAAENIEWLEGLQRRDEAYGKKGPICPYMKRALIRQKLDIRMCRKHDAQRACEDALQRQPPSDLDAAQIVIVPGMEFPEMLDVFHKFRLPAVVDKKMFGEFHPEHSQGGLHSDGVRPLRSPHPMFACRALVPADREFFKAFPSPGTEEIQEIVAQHFSSQQKRS